MEVMSSISSISSGEENSNSTGKLPVDILIQIFCLLSVKVLCRLCCVSKTWKNLIRFDRSFLTCHLQKNVEKICNLLLYSAINGDCASESSDSVVQRFINTNENWFRKPFFLGNDFFLVGAINGVLCFFDRWEYNVYLWNPALHQCWNLPSNGNLLAYRFDVIGFIYEPSNDEYKVVKLLHLSDMIKAYVYDLKRHSWRVRICHCYPSAHASSMKHSVATVLNGALHWITYRSIYMLKNITQGQKNGANLITSELFEKLAMWNDFDRPDKVIFLNAFDLNGENFREYLLTDVITTIENDPYSITLGLLKGCICVYGQSRIKKYEYEVWVMEEYGIQNSWRKLFVFPRYFIPLNNQFGLRKSERLLATRNLQDVILYDSERKTSEAVLEDEVLFDTERNYFFTDNYVESLVSVIPPRSN